MTGNNLRCLCLLCLSDFQDMGQSRFFFPVTALNSALTRPKIQQTELGGQKQSLLSIPLSQLIMAIIEYPFFQSFKMSGR